MATSQPKNVRVRQMPKALTILIVVDLVKDPVDVSKSAVNGQVPIVLCDAGSVVNYSKFLRFMANCVVCANATCN